MMKAFVYSEYGAPQVLRLSEIAKPQPKADEVLIRVVATTATTGDANIRGFSFVPPGFGFMVRLAFGMQGPRKQILGVEVAGVVEAVGANVSEFKVGDEVFGLDAGSLGGYAEYACRRAAGPLVHKPAGMSFADVVSVPFGAVTAAYFLRQLAQVKPGERVLVNGASGGVGVYAVQIAKHLGAEVIGVCSRRNHELVRSLGADEVIDYEQVDYRRQHAAYDVILDTVVGHNDFARNRAALRKGGRYAAVAGGPREIGQLLWTRMFSDKKVLFGSPSESKAAMEEIKALLEIGALRPVIDRIFPFEELVAAHQYLDSGRKRGGVVVAVSPELIEA